MRRGEIAAMDWQHVDLSRRSVTLPVTKTGISRTIPLSIAAKSILTDLLKGKEKPSDGAVWAWEADCMTREFIRLCQEHGFDDLRFHDLRHEATSRLFEKGLALMEVASYKTRCAIFRLALPWVIGMVVMMSRPPRATSVRQADSSASLCTATAGCRNIPEPCHSRVHARMLTAHLVQRLRLPRTC